MAEEECGYIVLLVDISAELDQLTHNSGAAALYRGAHQRRMPGLAHERGKRVKEVQGKGRAAGGATLALGGRPTEPHTRVRGGGGGGGGVNERRRPQVDKM